MVVMHTASSSKQKKSNSRERLDALCSHFLDWLRAVTVFGCRSFCDIIALGFSVIPGELRQLYSKTRGRRGTIILPGFDSLHAKVHPVKWTLSVYEESVLSKIWFLNPHINIQFSLSSYSESNWTYYHSLETKLQANYPQMGDETLNNMAVVHST